MKKEDLETHQFLPSGEWEGFYCYNDTPAQHKMFIELTFKEGKISGSGTDDVAPFTWKGDYDLNSFKIRMMKTYPTHQIYYKGDADENGIWGMWEDLTDLSKQFSPEMIQKLKEVFKDKIRGGFHIWPKKQGSEENANALEEEIVESKKLKELFVKKL